MVKGLGALYGWREKVRVRSAGLMEGVSENWFMDGWREVWGLSVGVSRLRGEIWMTLSSCLRFCLLMLDV
jgi:hypothetical protein